MRSLEKPTRRAVADSEGPIGGCHAGEGRPAASSAGEPGSPGSGSRALRQKASGTDADAPVRQYVEAILERYLWLPGTSRVTSRHDRRCAETLFRRGVPLETVLAALMIGVARRTFRGGDPLPRVRALHYFSPVIEGLQQVDLDPTYLHHLERKLRPLATEKARLSDLPQAQAPGASARSS